MHARIDELLNARNGEPLDAAVRAHIDACAACSDAMQQLARQAQSLRELPPLAPPAIDFAAIHWRAATQASRHHIHRWQVAAAVLVCVVMGLLVFERDQGSKSSAPVATVHTAQPTTAATRPESVHDVGQELVAELVAQSRELDGLLQQLPPPRQVQRVSFAATVDRIEQRVQWIDMQLSAVADANAPGPKLEQQLWQERVNLMDSLVKVRYAESLPQSF